MRFLNLAAGAALLALPVLLPANELLRVYDLAAQNDTQLRAASAARDAAAQAKPAALGALLPQVNAVGSVANDRFTLVDTPPAACAAQGGSTSGNDCVATSEPYNVQLSVNQVLFNKELFERWRQGGDRAAAGEVTYRAAVQNLALRATEGYFNVLAAADNLRFANAENQAIERQLELAKKRFEVGLSAITDVQEAQARYDLTVANTIAAEQALASAREALAEITGPTAVAIQPLRDDIPLQGPDPDSVNDWLKAAADSNLDLTASQIQADIARRDISISGSGHYPTLGVNGTQVFAESSGFNTGEFEDQRITLQLNVPIFAGGSTQANVRASRSIHEQRLAELESVRRRVERTTRDAYQGVIAGVSLVKARKQAVLSNTTAMEAAEVGLEVGTRTAVDVLDSQQLLYSAQRDYARARYDYLLNVLRLKSAAGQLSQQDLIEIDNLLTSAPASEVANLPQ